MATKIPCSFPGCIRTFKKNGDLTKHVNRVHHAVSLVPVQTPNFPQPIDSPGFDFVPPTFPFASPSPPPPPPQLPQEEKRFHPYLTGDICDEQGNYLPPNTPPPPRSTESPWSPFEGEAQFRLADLLFRKVEMSQGNIDELMDIWSLYERQLTQATGCNNCSSDGPFDNHKDLYSLIDNIVQGGASWKCFQSVVDDSLPVNAPEWQKISYQVWYRDPDVVIANILANPEFRNNFDVAPYVHLDSAGKRHWADFMSGNFAWRHAGQTKTTVSVATGHVEYHPLYLSIGNVTNASRRAHPDRKYDKDPNFRVFKKKLYHASIAAILQTLKPGMKTPVIRKCPDGDFRRVLYDLAAFIADYPEQVYVSDINEDTLKAVESSLPGVPSLSRKFSELPVFVNTFSIPRMHSMNRVTSQLLKSPGGAQIVTMPLAKSPPTNQRGQVGSPFSMLVDDGFILPSGPSHTSQSDLFDAENEDVGPVDKSGYPRFIAELGKHIGHPALEDLTVSFFMSNSTFPRILIFLNITSKIHVYHSAIAVFFAPSDHAGIRGMQQERIRCTPSWYGVERRDCILATVDEDKPGFQDLDGAADRRTRELDKIVQKEYGGFPKGNIHEMLLFDLLHQIVKGCFKDMLVDWTWEYLLLKHGEKRANEIFDDIDRRLAAVPAFPGLRCFPHGRRFKQWTGNDSKALMKIFLPAVAEYLPEEMLFSFCHEKKTYPCVLIHWFNTYGQRCDPKTGLWQCKGKHVGGSLEQAVKLKSSAEAMVELLQAQVKYLESMHMEYKKATNERVTHLTTRQNIYAGQSKKLEEKAKKLEEKVEEDAGKLDNLKERLNKAK
ncbi:hypothetical protein BT96DRAFT_981388 [Gymnopus androsaceus JB14]|uniref:C2H2-type domain-containing protein n=1 Tax=Gymnopus androsaceus JB14 TaxID=1447944 RepID=A0A6A4GQA7_9AGAR|nr:hypothetical protein BT96DRAFT_981388 [Gymnopus androsaceus JB14]